MPVEIPQHARSDIGRRPQRHDQLYGLLGTPQGAGDQDLGTLLDGLLAEVPA